MVIAPIATVSFHNNNPTWSDTFLKPTKQIIVDVTELKVAIAQTPEEITQGLSGRSGLADDEGLLFIFDDSAERTFWMKDMLFNIDMIFIEDGKIVDIAKNMPKPKPWDWPATYTSKSPADMVLEVKAGLSERNGWIIGDSINYQN
ncbi:MAG: DUF192 domain-containing protein [Patescibacteria group bacterium]|nr:DUF192 domain-containing protein [Patescibacteria group bacterium]